MSQVAEPTPPAKRDTLPRYCRECSVRFACHGECPRNRFVTSPDGEAGLNYLWAGYKAFFTHVDRPMRVMADLLRRGRYADEIMPLVAADPSTLRQAQGRPEPGLRTTGSGSSRAPSRDEAEALRKQYASSGRNEPCPCGSGRKYKHCHGGSRDDVQTSQQKVLSVDLPSD